MKCEGYRNGEACPEDVEWYVVVVCNHDEVHGGDPVTKFAYCPNHAVGTVRGTMAEYETISLHPVWPAGHDRS